MFDALVAGKYIDMLGRAVEFKAGDLEAYVNNTRAAIEATRGESGEVAGLPIDARNHDKQDAAGWIVAIELVGNVIRVLPKWTDLGKDLISRNIQRFFSATVDVKNRVVLGGTLTNWPALRNEKGQIQLRPIELSESLREIVTDDSPQVGDGNMAKANEKTPETVEQPEVKEAQPAFDLAALRQEIKADILAEFQEQNAKEQATDTAREIVDMSGLDNVADVSEARKVLGKEIEMALRKEYERIQANAGQLLASMMAEIKRDQQIAEFSQRVTGGTDARPYGLPVGQEEVETFLLSLNDQQRAAAESILTRVHEQGLIEFSEIGHGKKAQGTAELSAPMAAILDRFIADGGTVEEFFANNPEVGEMSQYNLAKYKEK